MQKKNKREEQQGGAEDDGGRKESLRDSESAYRVNDGRDRSFSVRVVLL